MRRGGTRESTWGKIADCALSAMLTARNVLLSAFFLLLARPPLNGQGSDSLRITVVDENGSPVPSARISLQLAKPAVYTKCETDFAGRCTLGGLAAGGYALNVQRQGFYALTQQNVRVAPYAYDLEVELRHLQEVKETVNVVESPPDIDPAKTANTESLSGLDVVDIPYPVTRDYRNILPFIPGVVADQNGQPHLAGGHAYSSLDLLDGFDVTDPVDGQLHVRVSTDAIRSIDVSTTRYSTQFGRSTAGVLNLTTGIGDDHFHYSATNFLPSFKTNQGVYLDKVTPRVTLSGPISKGRAWFFLAPDVEYNYGRIAGLPRGADRAARWRFSNLAKAQVNLTDSNILTASFLFDRFKQSHTGLSAFTPLGATYNLDQTGYLGTLKDQHYFHSGALLETGLNVFEQEADANPLGSADYELFPNGSSGSYYNTALGRSRRTQFLGNIYLPPLNAYGRHEFKAGFDADRIVYHQFYMRRPISIFRDNKTLDRFLVFPGEPVAYQRNNTQGSAYAQDRWSPLERLLVEGGVRFDWDEIVRDVAVQPRLAGTYILDANGDTKLSLGVGSFYDATNLSFLTRPLAGTRLDYVFAADGRTQLGPPTLTRFSLPPVILEPRAVNYSAAVERKLPRDVSLRVEFLQRRSNHGFVYVPQGSVMGGDFRLTNNRREHYTSLSLTARYTLAKSYPFLFSYTRSRALSNAVLDYSVDLVAFGAQGAGPLAWDVPNRFIAWGMAPLPSLPLIHKLDFAFSLDVHSGSPFSAVNQFQQVVGLQAYRFPTFFSFNPFLEKRLHFWKYDFAVRGGFENVTSHNNPSAVNSNVDSTQFLRFSNFDRRTFTARLRLLGKKK
jgi:hypothetical protein